MQKPTTLKLSRKFPTQMHRKNLPKMCTGTCNSLFPETNPKQTRLFRVFPGKYGQNGGSKTSPERVVGVLVPRGSGVCLLPEWARAAYDESDSLHPGPRKHLFTRCVGTLAWEGVSRARNLERNEPVLAREECECCLCKLANLRWYRYGAISGFFLFSFQIEFYFFMEPLCIF